MGLETIHGHSKWAELRTILQKIVVMDSPLVDGDVFQTTVHSIYYLFSGKVSYAKFCEIPAMLATLPVEIVDQFLSVSFPAMCADLISDTSLQGVLPFLTTGVSGNISFSPTQAYVLLAQCFLCVPLMSERDDILLSTTTCHLFFTNRPRICHKLCCLLNYFNVVVAARTGRLDSRVSEALLGNERRIVIERMATAKLHGSEWWAAQINCELSSVIVQPRGVSIESQVGGIQADFANKHIGGGVLRRGCVQEEIRMIISPELLLAVLFCDPMEDNEAVVVRNTVQFSAYSGYASSFTCLGFSKTLWSTLQQADAPLITDDVLCIDALPFGLEREIQYHVPLIVRELEKCRVGTGSSCPGPFVTGNWGCGVFGGDPQLKAIIQWLACSMNSREMIFCPYDDETTKDFSRLVLAARNRKISVGQLFMLLVSEQRTDTLQFLLERIF